MLGPYALFVVSDKITVDHVNRVLADEESYERHDLVLVVEPDLSSPYSAIPRQQYNSAGKKLPDPDFPPPVSAELLTPANNPFIGASLESCAAYLRASASVDTIWNTEMFVVLDEQYITHETLLIAHSFVVSHEKPRVYLPSKLVEDGVQAYPCEKGTAVPRMSLRTGIDFQEDLERYQNLCKSRGVEDRSVGFAWEWFAPNYEDPEDDEQGSEVELKED